MLPPFLRALVCVVVVLITPIRSAHAQGDDEAEAAWAERRAYHRALRRVDLAEIGVAVGSVAFGGYAVSRDDPFLRGFGGAFLAGGGVHLASGIAYTIRSQRGLRPRLAPASFRQGDPLGRELASAERHAARFILVLMTDAGVIAGGLATAIAGYARERDVVQGVGFGVAAQGVATLLLDLAHQNQGRVHLGALRDLDLRVSVQPVPGGRAGVDRERGVVALKKPAAALDAASRHAPGGGRAPSVAAGRERRRSHSSTPMWPRRASPKGTSERASTRPPKYRASGSLTTSRGSPTAFR